ncbi:uncharacterized protein LOC131154463 [Malania oleifera]|uniref:uncharacterized protein LOC131154463 n=1 Tax=Malania oleifera TaxID=397392 RepID=UPI0025AE6C75|nr:uncharacterized protein LOC131154463 [Malania oleifera]
MSKEKGITRELKLPINFYMLKLYIVFWMQLLSMETWNVGRSITRRKVQSQALLMLYLVDCAVCAYAQCKFSFFFIATWYLFCSSKSTGFSMSAIRIIGYFVETAVNCR